MHDKAVAVLEGKASTVAAAVRRKATYHRLGSRRRANADVCANYLTSKASYLDYPNALEHGWPIATGVMRAPAATS